MMNTIGFPGLGIPNFNMDGIIFTIGNSFSLRWYGIVIAAGFFLATMYASKRAGDFFLKVDDVIDMLIWAVPSAIIGARLYYVVFNWQVYKSDIGAAFRIWDGGLAIYGAVIGAVTACIIFCSTKKLNKGAMLDLGALGLLIGQAIGRWGNFFNAEVYGTHTDLPWRMSVNGTEVHPLFLYESLWNAAGFILLHFVSKKRKFNGQIFIMYIAWYGLGRGIFEGMRTPQYILMLGPMRVSQVLAFLSFLTAVGLLIYHFVFKNHDPEDLGSWAKPEELPETSAEAESLDETVTAGAEEKTPDSGEPEAEENKTDNTNEMNENAEVSDDGSDS